MRCPGATCVALAAAFGWLSACSPGAGEPGGRAQSAPATTDSVQDTEGRWVPIGRPPKRVVSLVPSVTEVIQALGDGQRLVGRTDFDTAPELAHLPSVGGGLQPSLEVLISLRPDLVIRFAGESDRATPERLDDFGIQHFAVRPEGVDDVRRIVFALGRILGRTPVAESWWAGVEAELDAIRLDALGAPRVTAAFLVGGRPPWVAGQGTFIHELIELGGGVNAFADLSRPYGPVSPEEIRIRDIEVFLAGPGTAVPPGLIGDAKLRRLPPSVKLPGIDVAEAARAVARALRAGS